MNLNDAVQALLARADRLAECKEKRVAWVHETVAAWGEAQREMDDRCTQAAARLSEEEFDRLFDQEQAKGDAIRAPLQAAADEDRWPRELVLETLMRTFTLNSREFYEAVTPAPEPHVRLGDCRANRGGCGRRRRCWSRRAMMRRRVRRMREWLGCVEAGRIG